MNTRIRTIFQDSDKHFDPKNTQSYNLTILLSEDGFSFIIADPALGKYISLCIYEPDEILPPGKTARSEKILIAFLSFVNNHPFLGSPLPTPTDYRNTIQYPHPAALYDAGTCLIISAIAFIFLKTTISPVNCFLRRMPGTYMPSRPIGKCRPELPFKKSGLCMPQAYSSKRSVCIHGYGS